MVDLSRHASLITSHSSLPFWRRWQDSNLHRFSPGGLANRCHTVRRHLRGLTLAEGERIELSRAEARQFSGLLQYRYANSPRTLAGALGFEPKPADLEAAMLPVTPRSYRMLRRGIEPLWSPGPVVLQTTAFPLSHLSESGTSTIKFSNNKKRSPNRI